MHTRTRRAALAASAVLLLTGCSSDDSGAPASPTPSGLEASAAPTSGASAGPDNAGTLTCTDGRDDSSDPTLDLYDVRLARSGRNISVIFDENKPPADTPLSWAVGFVSADGKHTVDLTADVRKNGDVAHGVTVDDLEPQAVEDPVRVNDQGMATLFPAKPVDALGPGTRWYATLGVDGDEVDYCPGGAELREVLDIVPLSLPARW